MLSNLCLMAPHSPQGEESHILLLIWEVLKRVDEIPFSIPVEFLDKLAELVFSPACAENITFSWKMFKIIGG